MSFDDREKKLDDIHKEIERKLIKLEKDIKFNQRGFVIGGIFIGIGIGILMSVVYEMMGF